MSRSCDVNTPLSQYDSESDLSRDSLDAGNDSVSSLRSFGILAAAASQPIRNNLNHGSPTDQSTSNAGGKQQAAPTVAAARRSRETKRRAKIPWWWWWEIGGALLSIICVGLILVVLFMANNRALAAWPLWIQPNSLIAVFTTVGKSAMMVPIASCISQLKWNHFELRANRLSDLQLLDEASRGPWGSLMLLADVRTRAFTARALAILSLMSLGFDPSAQQILDFPTRDTRINNTSASIGVASSYHSKAFIETTGGSTDGPFNMPIEWNQDLFKLQSSIFDGISRSAFQPPYSCPGERCSWPEFTTLGVCSSYLNLTDTVEVECVGKFVDQQNCSYRFPTDLPINSMSSTPILLNVSYAQRLTNPSALNTFFASRGDIALSPGWPAVYATVVFTIKVINESRESLSDAPQTEAYYSSWYWCEKTYHNVTANSSRISDADCTSEMLTSIRVDENLEGNGNLVLVANSTGHNFSISTITNFALFPYLSNLFTRDVVNQQPRSGPSFYGDSLDLSGFLYRANLKNVTENLAKKLTDQVRSVSPGDNNNATLFTSGDVFVKEVYIQVTWAWLTIPLAETLITTVLLVCCILLTRDRPLLKTSLIALLVHGLDGWSRDEPEIPDPEDSEKLEEMAENMRARFRKGGDGRLQFFKADI